VRKDDDSIRQLELTVLKWVLITDGALCLLSLFLSSDPMGMCLGLLLGGFTGYMGFLDLSRTLQKSTYMQPERANRYVSRKYNTRLIITGAMLFLAIYVDVISLIGMVMGLLLIKLVIYMTQLCGDREFFKRIFRRKEE